MSELSPDFRSGYVAIVGWPNVGKSTLVNALVGTKLSIVSPKSQTTRDAILGIVNEPQSQMVLIDTPGWLKPQDNFQAFMRRAINRSIHDDADVILWMVDPRPTTDEDRAFATTLLRTEKKLVIAINKIDTVSEPAIVVTEKALKESLGAMAAATPIVRLSAKTTKGMESLKQRLKELLPVSPPFFPVDQITDRWERFYTVELIREQIFRLFDEEVPHATAVVLEDFIEIAGRKDQIRVTLFVETEGQKKILIGERGQAVRSIGEAARKEIEARLGRDVFLELTVKIHKHWRKDGDFVHKLQGAGDGQVYT